MKSTMNRWLKGLVTTTLAIGAAFAAQAADLSAQYDLYQKSGKAIVEMAIKKQVDGPTLEKNVKECVAAATLAAQEYAKAFPAGAKLLKTVIDNIPAIEKLAGKEIEKEWHDMGYFKKPGNEPGLDVSAEENEHFTDPIHAIVHPLIVLKAAQAYASGKKDEDLKAVKEEMEEGLEQMERLKKKLAAGK